MRQGFTLIQISILLLAASVVLIAVLPSTRTALNGNNDTTVKMNAVLTAMRGYEAANAKLPCPADASQPTQSTSYGVANAGGGATSNCVTGSPAGIYADATNHVAIGGVPVRALGLSNDYALDAFGRDITYAVDTNATTCFSGALPGQITVTDNGTANTTIAALVSHGADGHGAWIPLTGSSGTAVRLNAGSTDADQLTNAHVNSSFVATTTLTNFVRKMPTATFDDLVVYKSTLWTLNAAPASSAPLLPSVTPPASASYYTGQALTFTVTYGSTVTVTGTPELTLSIPQQSGPNATRYATYVSSSGNTITFTYTVQSTDYAPTSPSTVAVSSPIVLNGGSITVGGGAACLSFTPPSLTGVLLNPVSIYVADFTLNRVQQFTASGSYITQFGSTGGGNGQFTNPNGMAIDSGGNLWVPDFANNGRVQEFSGNGTYLSTLGSGGSGNGQFLSPYDVAFDGSGNIWVADHGNNRVQKLNSSGAWVLTIPSSGCGAGWPACTASASNGQFNAPEDIAVDAGGNVWVSDRGNNRVQKFSSSGTFLLGIGSGYQGVGGSIGASGSGNGQLNSPIGIAIDAGGNVWVVDSSNARVQEFNSSGVYQSQLGCATGGCTAGSANGQFNSPSYVAIDPSGNVWVTEWGNYRVDEFSNCGVYLSQFGTYGTGNGQFEGASGIAITGTPGGGGACIASVTPPANAAYSTGQALTFTVTYNAAVTVTGTPQLVLTVGSNTRYANYASGSGTTTLTFSYTIQASDTATGISSTSSINLNGGAITTNGNSIAANLSFTAPTLSGLTINATAFMLVPDRYNNRVQKLDLLGNFVDQLGCASGACSTSTANGQFNLPYFAAVDGSGNIWVSDFNNNRLQEFSSSGVWIRSVGGPSPYSCETSPAGSAPACAYGSGNGQFYDPSGILIDGSGNIWVVDQNNNRVQEFNSSGVYQSQFGGTYGCGAGQFENPTFIHADSSGNIYVNGQCIAASSAQIEEFSSSGAYVKTYGPNIPGYSNGSLSTDVDDFNFDSCGNMWIQDEISDPAGYFVEVDYAGNFVKQVSLSSFTGAQGVAIDASGKIYSVDEDEDNNIDIFNSSGTYLSSIGGSGSAGGQFNSPSGITLVGTGVTRLALSACPAVILAAAGPSNGNYTTGSTLGFAVTYDQAVTVTGTPYINVTIGSNTRQAAYVSGSGTTTLTFQYTTVAADYSTSGITMNVPIVLNGGTIMNGSNTSNLYFQPPTLTGVTIGTLYQIFLTHGTTSWVVPGTWNNAGNTIEALGCGGNGAQGSATTGGAGGGGGEYRKATNVTLSGTITVSIPAGGAASTTTFNTNTVIAHCGGNAVTTTAGTGGSGGTGATHNNGGAGGTNGGTTQGGGGGGGAAGPSGVGKAGGNGANTEGGGGGGGGSNNGVAGSNATATHGKGGNSGNGQGGSGGQTGSAGSTTASTSVGPSGTAASGAGGAGSGGASGASHTTGAGGAGAIDTTWDATHGPGGGGGASGGSASSTAGAGGAGGTYGGGGGGSGASGSGSSGAGGTGGAGLIIITYTNR